MLILIYILICLFLLLLVYQFSSLLDKNIIEGLETNNLETKQKEYKPYNLSDPNNSLILAQQNAGNIEVLKGRIDNLDGVKDRVDNMQQSIDLMQTQINGLVQQQSEFAQEMVGSTPPKITGTNQDTVESVEASI